MLKYAKGVIVVLRRAREATSRKDMNSDIAEAHAILNTLQCRRTEHSHVFKLCSRVLEICSNRIVLASGDCKGDLLQDDEDRLSILEDLQQKITVIYDLMNSSSCPNYHSDSPPGSDNFDSYSASTLDGASWPPSEDAQFPTQSNEAAANASPFDDARANDEQSSARGYSVRRPVKTEPGTNPRDTSPFADLLQFPSKDDVPVLVGLEDIQTCLSRMVTIPKMLPSSALVFPRRVPCSALLYGPPGTGKTTLACRLAAEHDMPIICVSPSTIFSKWTGDSEMKLLQLFRLQAQHAPCVLFFDEIDALLSTSTSQPEEGGACRLRAEFLILMTQFKNASSVRADGSLVVAATNRIGTLDGAVLRRFDRKIQVREPTDAVRTELVSRHIKNVEHDMTQDQLRTIVTATQGWSTADLLELISEAAMKPVTEYVEANHAMASIVPGTAEPENHVVTEQPFRPVTMLDFQEALASLTAKDRKAASASSRRTNSALRAADAPCNTGQQFTECNEDERENRKAKERTKRSTPKTKSGLVLRQKM